MGALQEISTKSFQIKVTNHLTSMSKYPKGNHSLLNERFILDHQLLMPLETISSLAITQKEETTG
jgi:hypothetical protein